MIFANQDPRIAWDERESEVDELDQKRAGYVDVAHDINHPPSIKLAEDELGELRTKRAAYRAARARLDEAVAAHEQAAAELTAAREVDAAGTLDPQTALTNRDAVIVAEAKLRYLAPITQRCVFAAGAARTGVAATFRSEAEKVVTDTLDLVTRIFEHSIGGVVAAAEDQGKRMRAAESLWWPVAEEIARRKFAAEHPKRSEWNTGTRDPSTGQFVADHRRERPHVPSAADLEQVFERRRGAFRAERERVRQQYAALGGEIEAMEGTV